MGGKNYSIEDALKSIGKDVSAISDDIITQVKAQLGVLAQTSHAKILEKAQALPKSLRPIYTDALKFEKISVSESEDIWVITLDKSAGFIEDGVKAGSMIERILNGGKPAKVGKDGKRYKIIPFAQNKDAQHTLKGPNRPMSSSQAQLANFAKVQMEKQGMGGIIRNAQGKPILDVGIKVDTTNGKSPSVHKGDHALLKGLTLYQTKMRGANGKVLKDKQGNDKIKRNLFTFRVISEKQVGSGLWDTKGMAPADLFKKTMPEIDVIFDKIVKDIIDNNLLKLKD